jgi:hypothetical protein
MAMPGRTGEASDWEVSAALPDELLPQIVAYCSHNNTLAWNAPDTAQIAHYARDPRERIFLAIRRRGQEWCGGAFLVQAELQTPQGLRIVPTVDSVFLRRDDAPALAALFQEAARCSGEMAGGPIAAPNLSAFDQAALQSARIRQMGVGFQGYVCGLRLPFENSSATTVEIV